MSYLGLAVVIAFLWPTVGFVRQAWRAGEGRRAALGVAAYTGLALALAIYQFFLR